MARIDLRENEFFERFVGPDHVDSNDVQFWYQLLSNSFNFTRVQDPKSVDKTLSPFIDLLALNNSSSLNLGSLIRVTLDRVSRIKAKGSQPTNPYYVYQSFNAIYLIRTICKNFIETSGEDMLIQAFRAKNDIVPQQTLPNVHKPTPKPPEFLQKSSQPLVNNTSSQVIIQNPSNRDQTTQNESSLEASPFAFNGNSSNSQSTSLSTPTQSNSIHNTDSIQSKGEEVTPGQTMMDQFISTLIEIIVDFPLNDSTYLLQVEAINSLLVLLSIQMYSNERADQFYIFRTLMQKKCSIHALVLTKTLLNNFIRQDPVTQENGSIILGLASGLWKVLTLGYGQSEEELDEMPYLAKQSLLLLNVLTNHYTNGKNPYREAIIHCQDSSFNPSNPQVAYGNDILATASTSQSILASNNIKIDFGDLYETICKHLHNDQVALILYLLLHSNKIFKPYILTTAAHKLDLLVLPLLKILYSSIQKGSHHVYMVLIIFLLLSEEASFSESIHRITVHGVPWFKDRVLTEVSLGSFLMLIIIRSFQYNTFRVRDKFLHTNLFATMGNLSNHTSNLHPYACQRLVDLLERLTKRYVTITKTSGAQQKTRTPMEVFRANDPLARALATDNMKQEFTQDASAFELDSTPTMNQHNQNLQEAPESNGNPSEIVTISLTDQQTEGALDSIQSPNNFVESSGQMSPGSSSQSDQVNISIDDTKMDTAWIEEVIRMILEIINNFLDAQLANNSDLIYTLLYKRHVFNSLLSSHQTFYNSVINVERILTFFYNKIDEYQRQLAVEEIKDLIQSTSIEWASSQQPKDPNAQLLFRYVEDDQPEEFFIPYMWTKIYYSSGIAWNPKRIVLFNPEIA